MNISCIIVAASKSAYHRQITNNAISSSGVDCIVVETFSKQSYGVKTLFWNTEFNYNACLNYGILNTDSEYIALCNNDLVFTPGWDCITRTMKENEVLSASPFSIYSTHRHGYKPDGSVHFGYWIGHELLGWCIVIHRDLLSIIGKLDESSRFWCSDNLYADQIQRNGIKHLLDCGSIVNHIGGGSKTLNTLPRQVYYRYTVEEYNRYAKK
jgi:glycosyltransferase involved in cell wall biosynthesis